MAQLNQPVVMGYSSGKTCWFMAFRQSDFKVLRVSDHTWVTFVLGNLAQYVMTYTEIASTGVYVGYYPEDFLLDVLPIEVSYQQAGVSAALPDDLPVISTGQSQGVNVQAINTNVPAASNLGESTSVIVPGAVASGTPTTTGLISNLTNSLDDAYVGRIIIFTSGTLIAASAIITRYSGTTKALIFTAFPTAPAIADTFVIV